ncbi:hypothetical protein [Solibacillus isronensis]|uniref:hypothetical protein n=1 Tax=Solibacillus isronensis TaxID=412383 RepID=UPI0039A155EA
MDIGSNKKLFLKDIQLLKEEIIKSLSLVNLEPYREELKGRFNPERFREHFKEKASVHHIFKYVVIRLVEDSMQKVNPKLNEDGLTNWHLLSKNFRNDYSMLYELAVLDVKREQDFKSIFENTIYDEDSLNTKIVQCMGNYIPELSKYKWSTLDENVTMDLVEAVYPSDKRIELQKNMYSSPLVDFLLTQVGLYE